MKSSFYQEIQPERDVSNDNFSKGQINFNWTMGSSGYFNPYKSYIKIRFKLYKREGNADVSLTKNDGIGPNMFLADNLFQTLKMNLNNQCISEISDYVPQIASLKQRMYKSEEHMNNYLASTNFSQAYLQERICEVSANENSTDAYILKPSLGGTVAVTIGGAITLTVDHPDLNVGDVIVLTTNKELKIIQKTSNLLFTCHDITPLITAIGEGVVGWSYKKLSPELNKLYHNNQGCRDVQTFECIWRPCLAFFEIDEYIPACQALFNLQMTPQPNNIFQRCAIENNTNLNVDSGLSTDADNNYVFSIESMNMYLMKGIGEPITNKALTLQMRETRCQSQNLTTSSLHQKTFQVHPRTQELTLAYQYAGASISNNAFSGSKFKCNGEDELKLRRFWINFGGKQLPTPIPDTELNKTTKIDYMVQRYVESLNYTNSLNSPEPLRKWFQRGIYFHFSGYSDSEKEDRCFVSSQFDTFADNTIKPNVLLFDHYIKKVVIYIESARVQNVQVM